MVLQETAASQSAKRLNFFERYLTVWVFICMISGIIIGRSFPGLTDALRRMEFSTDSHINIPIAILIWLMIYPMMLKIDLAGVLEVRRKPKGA